MGFFENSIIFIKYWRIYPCSYMAANWYKHLQSTPSLSFLRRNKQLLFGLLGLIGGIIGALIAEPIELYFNSAIPRAYFILILQVILWAGLAAAFISAGLHVAIKVYNRRTIEWWPLAKKSIPAGFLAGAISGGIAQAIFGLTPFSDVFIQELFRAVCWAIFGAILGWRLSYSIPNLGVKKAVMAGLGGGFIGAIGFIIVSGLLVQTLGRMLGIGILGAALGLALVIVEERYRSAYLEVHWARNETSKFTLGSTPIYIGGGGEDDVFVYGIPHHAMSLVYQQEKVKGVYIVTGERKELHDGSRIQLGKVEMFVRIAQSR